MFLGKETDEYVPTFYYHAGENIRDLYDSNVNTHFLSMIESSAARFVPCEIWQSV